MRKTEESAESVAELLILVHSSDSNSKNNDAVAQ